MEKLYLIKHNETKTYELNITLLFQLTIY